MRNKADVGAELESSAKAEDVTEAMPADSGALQSEVRSAYQSLNVSMKEYRFIRDATFNELEDLHDLYTACSWSWRMSVVFFAPLYNARIVQGQASSTRDVFSKNKIENAVNFMSDVKTSRTHG